MRSFLFLICVLCIYGALFIFMPDRAFVALKGSAYILTRIAVALSIVFVLIFALNLFIKPGHLSRLFSKGFGIKEVALSVFAGIVSIGPIYAWYPLLKDLKSKGVRDSLLAVFLNCRSVKPVLLPVMISYFGWHYVLIFTVAMVLGSLLCGLIVEMLSGQ